MIGLYIHIPYCNNICTYCDFFKRIEKDKTKVNNYIKSLISEIDKYKTYFDKINTIYIGGGTPSSLELNTVMILLEYLNNSVLMSNVDEFTIECNPEDITTELLEIFSKYNVNRISLGVQSLNENVLKNMNRAHTKEDIYNSITTINKSKIDNISVDLIYDYPNQTEEEVLDSISQLIKLNIKHISLYALSLENKSMLSNKNIDFSEVSIKSLQHILEEHKFTQYEVSNYSLPGYESKHNLHYWNYDDYIGVGAGAHGKLDDIKYSYTNNTELFITNPTKTFDNVPNNEVIIEYIIVNLRKSSGLNLKLFYNKFGFNISDKYHNISTLISNKKLISEDGYLKVNPRYMTYLNEILLEFI